MPVQQSGMTQPAPKVFLSHASRDKARFVEPFAAALIKDGIEVFYDSWDIQAGDLVWKRISDGIESCDAVVLIASDQSLGRPWVDLETGAGLDQLTRGKSRLVLITLDGCGDRLPPLLRSLRFLPVDDVADFSSALNELVCLLFGRSKKPPLGAAPPLAHAIDPPLGCPLNKLDFHVLCKLAEATVGEFDGYLPRETCVAVRASVELDEGAFTESLEVLHHRGLLSLSRCLTRTVLGSGLSHARLTPDGFEFYLTSTDPSYSATKRRVVASIVNRKNCNGLAIAADAECSLRIVRHIAEMLDAEGLVSLSQSQGTDGYFTVIARSPALRRMIDP